MSSQSEISSFAVFDLETTGLPKFNYNKANITELTIHGFPAENVQSSIPSHYRRVNHSLTLQFNPRMIISQTAKEITGLDNYMLEKESHFDENAANLIINFLQHLRQPVCLVAHNGDGFDFPILKTSLKKLNMDLPDGVMCLDSYIAIMNLDKQLQMDKDLIKEESQLDSVIQASKRLPNKIPIDSHSQKEDFILNTIPFLNDETSPTAPEMPASTLSSIKAEDAGFKEPETTTKDEEKAEKNPADWQKINETTPKQRTDNSQILMRNNKIEKAENKEMSSLCNPTRKRRLDFKTQSPPGFYKLENIYIRLFGERPKTTHQAEADVVMLKDIIYKYSDSFLEYAKGNAKSFSSVKPLGSK